MKFKLAFKLLLLLSLSVHLISCSSDVDDVNEESGNATFAFDEIQVVSNESLATNKSWPDIKDKFVADLRVCFKDTVYIQSIVGEEFKVVSDLGERIRTTDVNGCLNWTEEFEFNYLADETFYQLNGSIQGEGNYKGQKDFKIALNPWSSKIVDLAHGSANNINPLDESIKSMSNLDAIEVEDFSVEVAEKQFYKERTNIRLDIITTPQIVRRDIDGALIKQKLSGGEFKIVYHLLSKTLKDERRRVLSTFETTSVVRKDGRINSAVEFEIIDSIDPNAIVELGVEISANTKDFHLGSDSGVMAIKDLDHRFSGKLIDLDMSITDIKSMEKNFLNNPIVNEDSFGFIIEQVSITKGAEGGSNLISDNTQRRVNAIFKINMVDSLILKGIRNHLFNVTILEKKRDGELEVIHQENHVTKNSSGVMEFTASIPFRSYGRRDYKNYIVKVAGVNDPYKDLLKERIVYINPWVSGAEFGIDDKFGTPQKSDTDNIPRIFIPSVSYDFVGNKKDKFKLNKALDLQMEKTLKLELKPTLKMDHNFSGNQGGYEKIVTGTYKLRFLLLTPKKGSNYTQEINLDDFFTLTAAEKEVQVENGKITTFIDLPMLFTDQLYYSYQNVALVELTPVDVDAELQKGYFVGPMIGMKKSGKIPTFLESGIDLSTGNVDIAKLLIERIEDVKHKLPEDYSLKNDYRAFVTKLAKHSITVPVFDNSKLSVTKRKTYTSINDTERELKSRYRLRISESEITNMIMKPQELSDMSVVTLCHLLFNQKAEIEQYYLMSGGGYGSAGSGAQKFTTKGYLYKKCRENPKRFIDFKKFSHVYKIVEQPESAHIVSKKLGSNRAYFTSDGDYFTEGTGERDTDYVSKSVSASLGIELSKFGMYGGVSGSYSRGNRQDVYTYNQHSNTVSTQFRTMNSNGFTFKYDRFNLNFKAKVKSCLLIAAKYFEEEIPKKYIQTGLAAFFAKDPKKALQTSHKRFYVCTKEIKTLDKEENWYFINLDVDGGMVNDAIPENAYSFVMRGDNRFEFFRQQQLANDEDIIFNELKAKNAYKSFKDFLEKKTRNVDFGEKHDVGFSGMLQ